MLEALDEDEKMVLKLSYDKYGYPGLTYQEISDYLGISVTKVGNVKKRAIRKIREKLKILR